MKFKTFITVGSAVFGVIGAALGVKEAVKAVNGEHTMKLDDLPEDEDFDPIIEDEPEEVSNESEVESE